MLGILKRFNSAQWLLALTNLGPLLGVVIGGWTAFEVVFLYWLENVMIGAISALRIALRDGFLGTLKSLPMAAFFCSHYGLFTYGHGVFVFMLLHPGYLGDLAEQDLVAAATEVIRGSGLAMAAVAIGSAHLFEWGRDHFKGRIESAKDEMIRPYGRVAILHLGLIVGGLIAVKMNQALLVLLLMIGLKTTMDLLLGKDTKSQTEPPESASAPPH